MKNQSNKQTRNVASAFGLAVTLPTQLINHPIKPMSMMMYLVTLEAAAI